MSREVLLKFSGYTLVQQDSFHSSLMTSDLACSRARMAASRPTVGKSSRNSSRVWPPSRYSKRVWKGTRVPRKTGVPPRTSGSRTIISLPEPIAFQVYSEGQLRPTGGWRTFAPFVNTVGSRGLMQRRASFSSSPVPTEIKDLAGHPQNPINPKRDRLVESHLSKTKGVPPARGLSKRM